MVTLRLPRNRCGYVLGLALSSDLFVFQKAKKTLFLQKKQIENNILQFFLFLKKKLLFK